MSRTVLITGAGGFVGAHMAEGFLAMGDTVIALDRAFDAATRRRLGGARLRESGLEQGMAGLDSGVDLVIHAAAITTPPHDYGLSDERHIQTNVDMLLAALQLARAHGARDFVFLSSSGVFDSADGAGIHLESTHPTADMAYARAKRSGEAATRAASGAGLRAISVRLGPVYGPHEAPRGTRMVVSQVRRWLDRVGAGQPITVQMPHEERDWTYAPDLPHALAALLRRAPDATGVVHLTSAQVVSNLALAQAVAALVEKAEIRVEPSGGVARLPMGSDRPEMANLYGWTPLAAGLAQTLAAETVP